MFKHSTRATIRRLLPSVTALLVAAAGMVALTPGVASAATYNGKCGAGYRVIDQGNLAGGTVFLAYSRATGKNCVVTVRDRPGERLFMAARVSLSGQPWNSDEGQYTRYAGPVFVPARHQCIDWGGTIGSSEYYEYGVHCD